MSRLLFLLLAFAPPLLGQSSVSNFVVDPSRPYVYLTFDHLAESKLRSSGEVRERIFIRVTNNCNIPVLFRASDADPDQGSVFADEVEPDKQGILVYSDQEKFDLEQKQRELALKQMPVGYSFEVSGVLRLQPGKSALFSVPRNHVGPFWHLLVKFTFDLKPSSIAEGPFTNLTFSEFDIPRDKREPSLGKIN